MEIKLANEDALEAGQDAAPEGGLFPELSEALLREPPVRQKGGDAPRLQLGEDLGPALRLHRDVGPGPGGVERRSDVPRDVPGALMYGTCRITCGLRPNRLHLHRLPLKRTQKRV